MGCRKSKLAAPTVENYKDGEDKSIKVEIMFGNNLLYFLLISHQIK